MDVLHSYVLLLCNESKPFDHTSLSPAFCPWFSMFNYIWLILQNLSLSGWFQLSQGYPGPSMLLWMVRFLSLSKWLIVPLYKCIPFLSPSAKEYSSCFYISVAAHNASLAWDCRYLFKVFISLPLHVYREQISGSDSVSSESFWWTSILFLYCRTSWNS